MAQDRSAAITEDEVDALLDLLIDAGVIIEDEETDALELSDDFDRVREKYTQTYLQTDAGQFRTVVAETFDLDDEEAAARIEKFGATREELAVYLALESFLDDPPPQHELAVVANMVTELVPETVVPRALEEVDEESYATVVREQEDVVLVVWKDECGSCDVLKDDLGDIMATAPDEVTFAGIDGEEAPDFRATFDVTSAPTTLVFESGDLAEKIEGRRSVEEMETVFERVYG